MKEGNALFFRGYDAEGGKGAVISNFIFMETEGCSNKVQNHCTGEEE